MSILLRSSQKKKLTILNLNFLLEHIQIIELVIGNWVFRSGMHEVGGQWSCLLDQDFITECMLIFPCFGAEIMLAVS